MHWQKKNDLPIYSLLKKYFLHKVIHRFFFLIFVNYNEFSSMPWQKKIIYLFTYPTSKSRVGLGVTMIYLMIVNHIYPLFNSFFLHKVSCTIFLGAEANYITMRMRENGHHEIFLSESQILKF